MKHLPLHCRRNWAKLYNIQGHSFPYHWTNASFVICLVQQKLLAINLFLLALGGRASFSNRLIFNANRWMILIFIIFLTLDKVMIIWRSSLDSEEVLWIGNTILMHFMVFTAFESKILSNSWSQALKHERILSDLSPHRTALVFLKPCIVKILSLLY